MTHLISCGAMLYGDRGTRFYYATQVTEEGVMLRKEQVVREAHGRAFWDLVNLKLQGQWDIRFDESRKTIQK